MAARTSLTLEEIDKLRESVLAGLSERELSGTVELEESGLAGRYRLFVISPDFEALSEGERQDVIWQVLKEQWPRAAQLRLTLAVGLSERESQGVVD